MFQRIRGAIDRTIAEAQEEARQRALADKEGSGATAQKLSSNAQPRKPRSKKPDDDGSTNPGPAVFEAAFAIDMEDSDDHASENPVAQEGETAGATKSLGLSEDLKVTAMPAEIKKANPPESAPENGELPLEIKTRLRKLQRLERTYSDLLRSYRIAHGRVIAIEPFEKALKENTPLTSIKDPNAFVEYLNQAKLKEQMMRDELMRVTVDKDVHQKTAEEAKTHAVRMMTQLQTLRKENEAADAKLATKQANLSTAEDKIARLNEEIEALRKTRSEGEAAGSELAIQKPKLSIAQDQIAKLSQEVEVLRGANSESEAKTAQLKSPQVLSEPQTVSNTLTVPVSAGGGGKKKKKKKKGGAAATPSETGSTRLCSPLSQGAASGQLQSEFDRLREQVADQDKQIEKLSEQKKSHQSLTEEVETLRSELTRIGEDHLDDKRRIQDLESEKGVLLQTIAELEKEPEILRSLGETHSKLQETYSKLKVLHAELEKKCYNLQSLLASSEQLAKERYNKCVKLESLVRSFQEEMRSLKKDSDALNDTQEELATKENEIRELEKREKDLNTELARTKRLVADRDGEKKTLQEKLTAENNARLRCENDKRVADRDLRRAETDKTELSAKVEKATQELQRVQQELDQLRHQIDQLEAIKQDRDNAREEAELKAAQYANAEKMVASMRDLQAELNTQLKEVRGENESLIQELGDNQRMLDERSRECEKLRKLLTEERERAEEKELEMQRRLVAAVEERDRIEDESLAHARKSEEFKTVIHNLDRENKTLAAQKGRLEAERQDWQRRRDELEVLKNKDKEMTDAVAKLRKSLDAAESQVREAEKRTGEFRRKLEELRQRFDKLQKDHKAVLAKQAQAGTTPPIASFVSGRSSIESIRSGMANANGDSPSGGTGVLNATDRAYLKQLLLQFLEQKNVQRKIDLVPVLGTLLGLDKAEKDKWVTAVRR